ncbi:hypothetical protein [Thalassomonas actiniarum]|uniref:Uncharacterized protein n=1 Tax=Thalassomonas actiniarum TaxID=485447 RepID=A0AAE9YQ78_9GAMM|nr:hypothetical protein [Thalassomonas actiniarum]WDD98821.1 hypothetical protein SG35_026930 [Thalassomonas actiniarum]
MHKLKFDEREVDAPEPIERILFVDSIPVADLFIDPSIKECTLAWPIAKGTTLQDILRVYFSGFLPSHNRHQDIKVECLIDDTYYHKSLKIEYLISLENPIDFIKKSGKLNHKSAGSLELLQISSGESVLELIFDSSSELPERIAILFSKVNADALIELFSQFHEVSSLRSDYEIASQAFKGKINEKYLLEPLPLIKRV